MIIVTFVTLFAANNNNTVARAKTAVLAKYRLKRISLADHQAAVLGVNDQQHYAPH